MQRTKPRFGRLLKKAKDGEVNGQGRKKGWKEGTSALCGAKQIQELRTITLLQH